MMMTRGMIEVGKLKKISFKFGCGDSGCIFGNRSGQTTNAGCRCLVNVKNLPKVRQGILALRKLVEDLDSEIEAWKDDARCSD